MKIWLRDDDSGHDVLLGEQDGPAPVRFHLAGVMKRSADGRTKRSPVSNWRLSSSDADGAVYVQDFSK